MKEQILNKAAGLFFLYGAKATSLDDIAIAAGVPKKTIQEYFVNKQDIIVAVVDHFLQNLHSELERVKKEASDVIELALKAAPVFFDKISGSTNVFFHELVRSFPDQWLKFKTYRKEYIHPAIINNLKSGIASGLFEPGLDIPFTADLRIHQILTCIDPFLFNGRQQPRTRLLFKLTVFYLNGIVTPEGKQLMQQYLSVASGHYLSNNQTTIAN